VHDNKWLAARTTEIGEEFSRDATFDRKLNTQLKRAKV
jgi:hypothetical protein